MNEFDSPSSRDSEGDPAGNKRVARDWFIELRDLLCSEFESIEADLVGGPNASLAPGKFERKAWKRVKSLRLQLRSTRLRKLCKQCEPRAAKYNLC